MGVIFSKSGFRRDIKIAGPTNKSLLEKSNGKNEFGRKTFRIIPLPIPG